MLSEHPARRGGRSGRARGTPAPKTTQVIMQKRLDERNRSCTPLRTRPRIPIFPIRRFCTSFFDIDALRQPVETAARYEPGYDGTGARRHTRRWRLSAWVCGLTNSGSLLTASTMTVVNRRIRPMRRDGRTDLSSDRLFHRIKPVRAVKFLPVKQGRARRCQNLAIATSSRHLANETAVRESTPQRLHRNDLRRACSFDPPSALSRVQSASFPRVKLSRRLQLREVITLQRPLVVSGSKASCKSNGVSTAGRSTAPCLRLRVKPVLGVV